MTLTPQSDVTLMLIELRQGKREVLDKLVPIVYTELHRLASQYLKKEFRKHTLQTTDLVHEAYLKLVGHAVLPWQNRAHFFGAAAHSMRQILVDYARKRKASKRGGRKEKVSLQDSMIISEDNMEDIIAIDEALEKLKSFDERQSQIVELRFFSGLTIEETAEVLTISPGTVKRDWNLAKAWLYHEIK